MELFSDEHIINRVNNGDQEAFRHLIDKHKDFVYSLSLKIAHNGKDAEEIAQDTFLKAFKQL
ncbi:MAG: RNA polymerase sigma factor [Crocinitomicaceae bacterium]